MVDVASIQVPFDTVLRLIVWANVCVAAAFLVAVVVFGICCAAETMRESKHRRASRQPVPESPDDDVALPRKGRRIRTMLGSGALHGTLLLAVGLTACAPKLQHLDGTALRPIGQPQALDNGWVAIDSCASGIHALVEMQIEANVRDAQPRDPARIGLRWSSSDRWRAGRVRVEGPFCPWHGPTRAQEPRTVQLDDRANPVGYGADQRCVYVVLAEFDLERLPTRGDSLVVAYGQQVTRLAWY